MQLATLPYRFRLCPRIRWSGKEQTTSTNQRPSQKNPSREKINGGGISEEKRDTRCIHAVPSMQKVASLYMHSLKKDQLEKEYIHFVHGLTRANKHRRFLKGSYRGARVVLS